MNADNQKRDPTIGYVLITSVVSIAFIIAGAVLLPSTSLALALIAIGIWVAFKPAFKYFGVN